MFCPGEKTCATVVVVVISRLDNNRYDRCGVVIFLQRAGVSLYYRSTASFGQALVYNVSMRSNGAARCRYK